MPPVELTHAALATAYRCTSCSRCYVAFGRERAAQILCACGAPLAPIDLPRGAYELRSRAPIDAAATNPGRPPTPSESDVGYGASHGYPPSSGGPTGPGDAPAITGPATR